MMLIPPQQCSELCSELCRNPRSVGTFSVGSDLNLSRRGWGMGWVLLDSLCDCLYRVLWLWDSCKEGQCEPGPVSQIMEEMLPSACGCRLLEVWHHTQCDFKNRCVSPAAFFCTVCILSCKRLQWIIYKAINLRVYFSFTKWFLERTYLHNAFLVVLR